MVKMKLGGGDGVPLYFFGLARHNIERLQAGDPILVDLRRMAGPAAKVIIAAGETESSIVEDMRAAGMDVPSLPQPKPGEEIVVVGPGQFPRGKTRADDEGAIAAQVFVRDGTLFIDYGKPVTWLGLGVADVERLIGQLQENLATMKRTGG